MALDTALLAKPIEAFAESAGQVVQDWRIIGIVTVGSLIGLYLRQRGDGKKITEVQEQVTKGGKAGDESDSTTMRFEISEGLRLMKFAVSHIENLPTSDDIKRLDGRIDSLGARVKAIEQR